MSISGKKKMIDFYFISNKHSLQIYACSLEILFVVDSYRSGQAVYSVEMVDRCCHRHEIALSNPIDRLTPVLRSWHIVK